LPGRSDCNFRIANGDERNLRAVFHPFFESSTAASSSQFDDAMIRTPGRRMTVAQLKQQMDRRFDEQRVRMDAGFRSVNDKLGSILQALKNEYGHHQQILNEREERLRDLETGRRTTPDIVR
jgi:hypothetical protein